MRPRFHRFENWEDFQHGMYKLPSKYDDPRSIRRAAEILRTPAICRSAMRQVVRSWPISCEVNLSNENRNRRAWLGQAACCLQSSVPEHLTRQAWYTLTELQQETANRIADECIAIWCRSYSPMPKHPLGMNVLEAARERIAWTFDMFNRVYVSFSGGKDSTVMLHLVADEAAKRGRKFGVLFIDLEGQYKLTIEHIRMCFEMYAPLIEPYWCCLPIHLRNAVSVYETHWICWDEAKRLSWIREPPENAITDVAHFPFARHGMEFEEFVPDFGSWYAQGERCACLVGIRTDESLNRYRTIASKCKTTLHGKQWATLIQDQVYNVYPIYDWRTEDLWTYHARNPSKPYNRLYDLMYKAGLTIHQQRICQPYGDDQRKGLWLFHLIEPETWARVVARVNGANGGALYVQESGNVTGYRRISKPDGHTWQSFAKLLLNSMPPKTREHFDNKILLFMRWWMERGYQDGIPDEADYVMEANRKAPSWRRVVKTLLRNDYWGKSIGFSQHKSDAYQKYLDLMRRRKAKWNQDSSVAVSSSVSAT